MNAGPWPQLALSAFSGCVRAFPPPHPNAYHHHSPLSSDSYLALRMKKALWPIILAFGAVSFGHQQPFPQSGQPEWKTPPSADETGHLIFNSVSSWLQHWPNTRWRNGTYCEQIRLRIPALDTLYVRTLDCLGIHRPRDLTLPRYS